MGLDDWSDANQPQELRPTLNAVRAHYGLDPLPLDSDAAAFGDRAALDEVEARTQELLVHARSGDYVAFRELATCWMPAPGEHHRGDDARMSAARAGGVLLGALVLGAIVLVFILWPPGEPAEWGPGTERRVCLEMGDAVRWPDGFVSRPIRNIWEAGCYTEAELQALFR
jgi:hypothetical protein